MLLLYMQVKRTVTSIQLPAISVRADIVFLDHRRGSSVVLLPILLESALEHAARLLVFELGIVTKEVIIVISAPHNVVHTTDVGHFRREVLIEGSGLLGLEWMSGGRF